jgi:hypothetical protein
MFGVNDLLLGGLLPMAFAAAAFAVGGAISRRASAAWNAGVVIGYATGATALEARGIGVGSAVRMLGQPAEAKHWLPIIAIIAVAPALLAAVVKRAHRPHWLLAALLCGAAPLWLLWGSSYLPSADVRASGFATNAWSIGQAVVILLSVGVALLGGWYLWESAESDDSPKLRSLLVIAAIVAAAATAGLTGSVVYAQLFGVLAASIGGCAAAGWVMRMPSGPGAAAGPIVMLAGCLLFLATFLSKLQPLQAAGLGAGLVLTAGWIPGLTRSGARSQRLVRVIIGVAPIAMVLWHAGSEYVETQRQNQKEAETNPYLNL